MSNEGKRRGEGGGKKGGRGVRYSFRKKIWENGSGVADRERERERKREREERKERKGKARC